MFYTLQLILEITGTEKTEDLFMESKVLDFQILNRVLMFFKNTHKKTKKQKNTRFNLILTNLITKNGTIFVKLIK